MKKLTILSILLFSGCIKHVAIAQNTGQNVVSVNIVNNALIDGTTTYTTGALQNIGQTYHNVSISINNATANFSISGGIQASSDPACATNWFAIGPQTFQETLPLPSGTVSLYGYGAYPCIRATFTSYSGGNLNITANYTGASNSAINTSD